MAFKLFAVLAIAGGVAHADTPRMLSDGRPAAGNTMGKSMVSDDDEPAALTPQETVAVQALGAKLGTLLAMLSSSEPAAVPRLIGERPACGNVASRAPRPRNCR